MRDMFPNPYTKECAVDFIKRAESMQNIFAIVVDNKAVGNIGYFPQNDIERFNAEIGYWIGESYWGTGIMTNVLKTLTNHIFTTTDMIRLFATAFETNPASMKVLEKAGFTKVGVLKKAAVKNNEVLDMHYFELGKDSLSQQVVYS